MEAELGHLAEIGAARAALDERELELIDRARQAGATWSQIAAALGLTSRQAAEQRRQRLVAAARSRRHEQDLRYAHSIVTLRAGTGWSSGGRWRCRGAGRRPPRA
ncbi:hypothetical protein AB0C29_31975, partial [Actinoplanes sp. NPDC048791]